jgi:hypothetical protein
MKLHHRLTNSASATKRDISTSGSFRSNIADNMRRFQSPRCVIAAAVMTTLALSASAAQAQGGSILFIGNSFTYAWGSPVRYYRANTVTDLNNEGIGGCQR